MWRKKKGKFKLEMEKEEVYTLEIIGSYISKREQSREIPDFICKINLKDIFIMMWRYLVRQIIVFLSQVLMWYGRLDQKEDDRKWAL